MNKTPRLFGAFCCNEFAALTEVDRETYNRARDIIIRGCSIQGATVALESNGCKLNQCETESLARRFSDAGYQIVPAGSSADVYVLNTCTVTHIADGKCRKLLRAVHRSNPAALIVATGCYAQRAGRELAAIEGVGMVVSNADKDRLVDAVGARVKGTGERGCPHGQLPQLRTRALVKIQEGCSSPCTFCVVPRVRGPERSKPAAEIISEISARAGEGYREVVLTGTRLGSYAGEGGLAGLIRSILRDVDITRLRISSLEPQDVTTELLKLWDDRRLCRHIHMPLQSGCDRVLERMGRTYRSADFARAASLAAQAIPGLAITTDVMVGFPGESDDEFEDSYRFCRDIGFARLHVFPFSPRPGTKAARMGNRIENAVKSRRGRRLSTLSETNGKEFRRRFIGRNMGVLWETENDGVWTGHTDNHITVSAPGKEALRYSLTATRLVSERGDGLWGELVSQSEDQAGAPRVTLNG